MKDKNKIFLQSPTQIYRIEATSVSHNAVFMSLTEPKVGNTIFLFGCDWTIDYVNKLTDVRSMYLTDMYYKDEEGNARVSELYVNYKQISIVITKV